MNLETIPVLVGLPLALLAGLYGLYRAARFALAIRRGQGMPYSPPCTPSRENTITGTPARRMVAHPYEMADFNQALRDARQRVNEREHEPLGK